MKQLVFSDAQYWEEFLPLTFTRPIADMRVGILTFKERWEKLLGFDESFFVTEKYLQVKYPEPEKRIFITCPEFSSNRKRITTNKKIYRKERPWYMRMS